MKVPEKICISEFKDPLNENEETLRHRVNDIIEYLETNTQTDEKMFEKVEKELNEEFEKKEEKNYFDNHEEPLNINIIKAIVFNKKLYLFTKDAIYCSKDEVIFETCSNLNPLANTQPQTSEDQH